MEEKAYSVDSGPVKIKLTDLKPIIDNLQSENDRYKKALELFANKKNWTNPVMGGYEWNLYENTNSSILQCPIDIARTALTKKDK